MYDFHYRFSDLLALAEDIDDIKSTRVLRGLPVRKAASASAAMGLDIRPPRSKSKKVQESSGSETESSSVSFYIITKYGLAVYILVESRVCMHKTNYLQILEVKLQIFISRNV